MITNRLNERRKELGYRIKDIAQGINLPERTVSRIFSGETASPCIDTIKPIADFLDISLYDLFADSGVVVGGQKYALLHEENVKLETEIERLTNEVSILSAELAIQKDKVGVLTSENDILRLELKYKEEIIAIHNYYIKKNGESF